MGVAIENHSEVQIMRGLNHHSIVKLLSFSESDEYYYLVLERKQLSKNVRTMLTRYPVMEGGELFHQMY